jgi:hypothetical protein
MVQIIFQKVLVNGSGNVKRYLDLRVGRQSLQKGEIGLPVSSLKNLAEVPQWLVVMDA